MTELDQIWSIVKDAIARRKADGSDQWQDGYPNTEVLSNDIINQVGFVLTNGQNIIGYAAVLINSEPAYASIDGAWITDGDFVVFHRVVISQLHVGKGLAKQILHFIEEYTRSSGIRSIKADTNFDNLAMLKTFESMGYVCCGEVNLRGGVRKAFEK